MRLSVVSGKTQSQSGAALLGTDSVYEVTPGGVQTTLTSGLNVPDGVAIDGSGNLYIANTYNEQVVKIDRADAPSLKFDSTQVGSTSADSPKAVRVEDIGNAALQFSALTYPADFPKGASGKATECTASTSLAVASTCTLTIDFSPVKPLGSKVSALLREDVNEDLALFRVQNGRVIRQRDKAHLRRPAFRRCCVLRS